jgi:hypothetical protein
MEVQGVEVLFCLPTVGFSSSPSSQISHPLSNTPSFPSVVLSAIRQIIAHDSIESSIGVFKKAFITQIYDEAQNTQGNVHMYTEGMLDFRQTS